MTTKMACQQHNTHFTYLRTLDQTICTHQLTGDQISCPGHGNGDGWVDVAAADVAYGKADRPCAGVVV